MKKIIITLSVVIISCNIGNAQKKDSLPPIPNYIIKIPVTDLQKSVDSLNMIFNYVGRGLKIDDVDQVKNWYNRVLGVLFRNVSMDTIQGNKPKK